GGQRWLALLDEGEGSSLRSVAIHVERVTDVGDYAGEKRGKNVSIETPLEHDNVIILLRGLDLHEGPLPTAHYSGEGDVGKPMQISLPNSTTKYTLAIDCHDERCPLVLSAEGKSQQLFVFTPNPDAGDFKGLRVIWAGDLDG